MAVAAAARPVELPRPRIRLRFVLGFVLFAAAVSWFWPRARAAWNVHSLAVKAADYALCMAGPTGPTLFRTNPGEFQRLVRRRLLGAPASDRPFTKCASAALELTGSKDVERAHLEPASSFTEYAGARGAPRRLDELRVSVAPLAAEARNAWPFVRGGVTALMKPSLGAREAIHPVALAKPGAGRGIPGWRTQYRAVRKVGDGLLLAFGKGAHLSVHRSTDGGLTWRAVSPRTSGAEDIAARCPAGDNRYFEIGLSADGNMLAVSSFENREAPQVAELAPESSDILAVACDERALVAALKLENKPSAALFACPFGGRCAPLPAPSFNGSAALDTNLDVARVHGTTVLSLTTGNVVRVTSSRDEGRSWAPFAVAFDEAEYPGLALDVRVPSRLLAIGNRVFLYGGAAKPSQSYALLVSDDHGASFRSPG